MKIVFFSPESFKFAEPELSSLDTLVRLNGSYDQLNTLVFAQHPEMILIGGFEPTDDLLAHVKHLVDAIPQSVVVLCAPEPNAELLIKAMRVGVREVFAACTSEELSAVIMRAHEHLMTAPVDNAVHHGQKIGFISAKGGDGGTCVVANLASALAKDAKNRIVVIDLSLSYGDVEIYLTNKTVTNNVMSFSSSVDRLDATLLDLMVHHVTDNLHLIPSPSTLEDVLRIKSADVEKLIGVLHRLVDAGNSVVVIEHNLDVMAEADWIVDLGPEGGSGGGQVVAAGTPEDVAAHPSSMTGRYLKRLLAKR